MLEGCKILFATAYSEFLELILQSVIKLTPSERPNIALITGTDLRDVRFAARVQKRFPALVDLWLEVLPPSSAQAQRVAEANRNGVAWFQRLAAAVLASRSESNGQREVERRMFRDEIESLRKDIYIQADIVQDPNAPELIARLRKIDPYFILTTESVFLSQELRSCARGLVFSRCDGWLPDYSGRQAIESALYRRDWKKVGSSIILLNDAPFASRIVRRATCCLAEDDTPESCLGRSGALGADLMCDTVAEAIKSHEVRFYAEAPRTSVAADTFELGNLAKRKIRQGLPRLIMSELSARHRV